MDAASMDDDIVQRGLVYDCNRQSQIFFINYQGPIAD